MGNANFSGLGRRAQSGPRPGPDEHAALRAGLETRAAAAARLLLESRTLSEVNLFFLPVLGCNIDDCVNVLCRSAGFVRRRCDTNHLLVDRVQQIDRLLPAAIMNGRREHATAALMAELQLRTAQHLPCNRARAAKDSKEADARTVRVFSSSPVEVRYIAMPLALGPLADSGVTLEQSLVIAGALVAWDALTCDVSVHHSLWVYLRLSDPAWNRLFENSEHSAEFRRLCARYRAEMDREFDSPIGSFAQGHHSVVVSVNSDDLASPDVVLDVLLLLCEHVCRLHDLGMWGAEPHVMDHDYLRMRKLNAEFVKAVGSSVSEPARRCAKTQ